MSVCGSDAHSLLVLEDYTGHWQKMVISRIKALLSDDVAARTITMRQTLSLVTGNIKQRRNEVELHQIFTDCINMIDSVK